jgi:small GTP-binding protein
MNFKNGFVGKTSILQKYTQTEGEIRETIGANSMGLSVDYKDHKVPLNVWDTAGQETYQCLIPMFIRCANVAVIVFDQTQPRTFQNLQRWLELTRETEEVPHVLLCCNKVDLEGKLNSDSIEEFVDSENLQLFKTSAKTGIGLDFLFHSIAEKVADANFQSKDFPLQPKRLLEKSLTKVPCC